MVGIVIVSHSAKLAEGVLELARAMAGADVKMAAAGGMALPDSPLGTDAVLITRAINVVYSDDGVVVLMDLGSAVLSAEMALEMLPAEKQVKIVLCEAPLVEGAISAAVQARLGSSLDQVVAEARGALTPKIEHLHPKDTPVIVDTNTFGPDVKVLCLTVTNPLGLHARPAARFVQTAGRFSETEILVRNLFSGRGPVRAKSINSVVTLGVRQGHAIEISAKGPDAQDALAAFQTLANENFGDSDEKTDKIKLQPPLAEIVTPDISDNKLSGSPGSPGIALGPARHFHAAILDIPTHSAEDPSKEWALLMNAAEKTRGEIETTLIKAKRRTDRYTAEIFEAHLLILNDEALRIPAHDLIFKKKCNAADAWNQSISAMTNEYRSLDDEYLRARAADVIDVGKQVLVNLLGGKASAPTISAPGILIVADLTPADTAGLDPSRVQAICVAFGGPASHSAILARAFGIPAVVGLGESILDVQEGSQLLVDADNGHVIITPDDETIKSYTIRKQICAKEEAQARAVSAEPAITSDGRSIIVGANIGLPTEAERAISFGAEGIGLFRTEFLFLGRTAPPNEEEHFRAYCAAAKVMKGRSIIIRTFDIGGDKQLPYIDIGAEENPFLGWRAIRMCLAKPEFFKVQLRAIVRAASLFPIKVMFPMVATLQEFRSAKDFLEEAQDEVCRIRRNKKIQIDTGMMVEIPAAALQAEVFAREVDFFSIGTNDLTQYTMAAERGNSRVANLADPLHPSVLRLVRRVVDAAHGNGKWVGVCGEAGADPVAVPVFLGLEVDELSMSIPAIPRIKQLIRGQEFTSLKRLAESALRAESAVEIRRLAISFSK